VKTDIAKQSVHFRSNWW